MAKARANAQAADDEGELEQIAGELYGLRPDDFAAARDEKVRTARAESRPALARELGRLRRPTQSAWLINLLWRDQRDVMQQLFQLADELSQAQVQASGPDLHRLTAQRRELEAALIRRARTLAEQAGVSVSASMEREAQETLAAALAQPEVAAEVRTGRLVKPAAYAGFGTFVAATAVGGAARATEPPADSVAARPAQPDDFEAHAARRARERDEEAARREAAKRRAEAERRVAEARAAVEAAAGELAERERAVSAAQMHHEELRHRLHELQRQLRELETEVAGAERAALAAGQQRERAEKVHADARRALEVAELPLKKESALE